MFKRLVTSAICLATLCACATTPEPCTSEWVEYKTDKILTGFASDNRGDIRRLKNFADTLDGGDIGPLTALQIPSMIDDFKDLATSFQEDALPDINAAIGQCNRPEDLVPAFTNFLRREGVGDDVLEWVELLAAFAVDQNDTQL